jgi:hypothetical protein
MDSKKWYSSKTILVNLLAGVALMVAQFNPEIAKLIQENFNEAGLGWALVNVILRLVTKDKVQIG